MNEIEGLCLLRKCFLVCV